VCLVAVLSALGGVPGGRVHAQPVKLGELEHNAVKARPALAASSAHISEAQANVAAARSAYGPTLSLLGEFGLQPGQRMIDIQGADQRAYKVPAVFPLGEGDAFRPVPRYGVTLDARGTLYDFGRTRAAVDAAVAQRRAAEADAHRTAETVVRDVRAAYVRWATAYALWSISQRSAQAAQERLRAAEGSIQEGARRTVDRTAAQAEAGFAQLEVLRSKSELDNARSSLAFLSATELSESSSPGDDVLELDGLNGRGGNGDQPGTGTSDLVASQSDQDSALVALREQHAAARASARAHAHAHAPVLSAAAQAGVQGQFGGVFPLYRVGVNMTVPLWDGGGQRAERLVAEARAAQLAAQARQYTDERDHLRALAEAAQAQAMQRIGVAEQLVNVCTARLSQLEEGYPLGGANAVELAEARASLQRAQAELVLAKSARAQAALGAY